MEWCLPCALDGLLHEAELEGPVLSLLVHVSTLRQTIFLTVTNSCNSDGSLGFLGG